MGILSDLVTAGTTIAGVNSQIKANDLNYQLQRENLDYQKAIQQTIFDREDNAVQRRVADLKNAGLSPTLAAGSSAGAGSVVSTRAPEKTSNLEALAALANVQTLIANQQKAQTEADRAKNELTQEKLNTDYYIKRGVAPVEVSQGWQQRLVNLLAPKIESFSEGIIPSVVSSAKDVVGAVSDSVKNLVDRDVNFNPNSEVVSEGDKIVRLADGASLTNAQASLLKSKGLYQQWKQAGFTEEVVNALKGGR